MKLRNVTLVLVLITVASCSKAPRVLEVQQRTELLAQPYPLKYPSTKPLPNSVLKILEPQRVTILSDEYRKDFHVYKVKDSANSEGYLIDYPGLQEAR